MKRILVALGLLIPVLVTSRTADASSDPGSLAPIAWPFSAAETSCFLGGCTPRPAYVHVERYQGKMPVGTRSNFEDVPIEVCDSISCQTVVTGLSGATDSNVGSFVVSASVPVPHSLNGRVLTFSFPKDLQNPGVGFGPKSNAVDSSKNRFDGLGDIVDKPLMQITYANLHSNEINNVGVCFNNNGTDLFVGHSNYPTSIPDHIDLTGFEEGRYSLSNGKSVVQSGSLSAGVNREYFVNRKGGMCGGEGGSGTVFPYQRLTGLVPGTVYTLTYTLTGSGKREIVGSLRFLTPDGCPSGDIGELSLPEPWSYAAIDADGRLIYPFTSVIATSWVKDLVGKRVAPLYVTAGKSWPLKNRSAPDWPNMWKYIPEFDDWAQSIDGQFAITTQTIISATIYAKCAPSSLKITVTALTEREAQAEQFCIVEHGQVIPIGDGPCLLKVVVSRLIASKTSVSKFGSPTVLKVPFTIKSFDSRSAGKAGRARACSFTVTTKSAANIAKRIVPCSRLKVSKGQSASATVATQSKNICQVKNGLLKRKSIGSCILDVRVKKGKKIISTQKVIVTVS